MLIDIGHAGAMVPISNFGHSLAHAAVEGAKNEGLIGLLTGIFDLTSSGLAFAIISLISPMIEQTGIIVAINKIDKDFNILGVNFEQKRIRKAHRSAEKYY